MKHINCDIITVKDGNSGQWISCVQLKADNHYVVSKQESKRVINFPHIAICKALWKLEKEYFIERFRNRKASKVVFKDLWRRGINKVLDYSIKKLLRTQFSRAIRRDIY